MDDTILSCYEMVISGHFHGKTSKKNVHYLGTQYQITFSDARQVKGFHVFDTDTRELEFVENPERMYHVIMYNDATDVLSTKFDLYKNTYVKIIVVKKTKPVVFDEYIDKMVQAGVININIIEDQIETSEEVIDMAQDTITIINDEIDKLEISEDKDKLKMLIHELYIESISI
jgi:hypothetical protein